MQQIDSFYCLKKDLDLQADSLRNGAEPGLTQDTRHNDEGGNLLLLWTWVWAAPMNVSDNRANLRTNQGAAGSGSITT